MSRCLLCGKEAKLNQDDICEQCAALIEFENSDAMICKHCGALAQSSKSYCPKCGQPLIERHTEHFRDDLFIDHLSYFWKFILCIAASIVSLLCSLSYCVVPPLGNRDPRALGIILMIVTIKEAKDNFILYKNEKKKRSKG
jgi:hypothetical protein